MILANLRERVTPSDVDLVLRVLEGSGHRYGRTSTDLVKSFDRLLDAKELPELLRCNPGLGEPTAALFIYVTVRHSLLAAGVDDRDLSDYLGALLFEFGVRDRAVRISWHDDAVYRYLTDIVADIQASDGRRAFLLRAHLGNFSLWLAGMYPDHIAARRDCRGGPGLSYYEGMGEHGFRSASDHRLARQLHLAGIYRAAADSFRALRVALNRLSDQLLFPHVHTPARLLRQVADGTGQ
jgi:hypothetical protein